MIELPSEVIGFHGTSRDVVSHLLDRDIRPSDQHFEWLGTGFYLWQDSPWRARQWAEDRYGGDAAVVVARVDPEGCLDLLDPHWQAEVRDADFEFVLHCIAHELPIPLKHRSWQPRPRRGDDQLVQRPSCGGRTSGPLGAGDLRGG